MSNTRLIVPFFERDKWDLEQEAKRQGRLTAACMMFEAQLEKIYNATPVELREMGLSHNEARHGK